MADQLFRLIASLDSHFAADDQLPADAARWREFRRSVIRMKGFPRPGADDAAQGARAGRAFPELTPAELSQALQVATTKAEQRAVKRH